jgi:N-acetylglucosaminyldiphosphoundecaprenol N-acetyl-beta-D-mannosaminyltransferase
MRASGSRALEVDNWSKRPVEMFGLRFAPVTLREAAEALLQAGAKRQKGLVVTPNVDHVVIIHRDPLVRQVYESATWVFADGMPIVWLSRILHRTGVPERVTGSDLLPLVASQSAERGLRLFFCGGAPGVADRLVARLHAGSPRMNVVGTCSPPLGFESDPRESARIVELCNKARPDLLFLGLGTPKQEVWAYQHQAQLDVGPILCFGGAFDLAAGTKTRAPKWLRESGLEWAWRLAYEPRRLWRRYLVQDVIFAALAVKEAIRARRRR